MSDYNELCRFMQKPLPTCISKITWPCKLQGKYIINGSIPFDLTDPAPIMYNRNNRTSKHWDTLEDAKKAVIEAGIKRFQLPDCSWFEVK